MIGILTQPVMQVRAVNRPKLSRYYDVIVFSTKCSKRSLASLLGGGECHLLNSQIESHSPFYR
jgi:hypothetical protein